MPAWRLDGQSRHIHPYDVGAIDGPFPGFATHAVLCLVEQPQTVNRDQRNIDVVHMGPPLENQRQAIDIVGTVANDVGLDPSQCRRIKMFVDDRLAERKAHDERLARMGGLEASFSEYVIHPPHIEPDESVSLWRFSCAGFVLRAYHEAGLVLVELESVPAVNLEMLKRAYPRFGRMLDRSDVRTRLGLGDGSEWPVVLVGYILHSLARDRAEIVADPYVVRPGDEVFAAQSD